MNDDFRDIIETGLRSDFWNEYLKPQLESEIERMKEYLIDCPPEKLVEVQNKIRTLKFVLDKPRNDYKALNEEG